MTIRKDRSPTAIITGASRGIGLAAARAFAARGYRLVLNARDPSLLQHSAASIRGPAGLELVSGDAAEPATWRALCDAALRAFGGVDVLVNNAGHFLPRRFEDTSAQDLDRLLAVHLKAAFGLSQLVVPILRRQGGGAIVNVTTVLTRRGLPGVHAAAQAAVKGALEALTRSLAHELGADGIRVNAVAPGTIRTGIFGVPEPDLDAYALQQPLRRIGEADEVADAIVHLAEAPFTTGVVLPVDGGVLAGSP